MIPAGTLPPDWWPLWASLAVGAGVLGVMWLILWLSR